MDGSWVQVLVALVAGAVGAGVVLVVRLGRRRAEPPRPQPRPDPVPPVEVRPPDCWVRELRRCEQAVHRAARAVDAVSSTPARQNLQAVVRRMGAELPDARALAELGCGLASTGSDAARRVREQLEDAAVRFGAVTDHVVAVVSDLVTDPDLSRVQQEVTALRAQFPLLRPMSAVLNPTPAPTSTPDRSLLPA
ncbi:hypothetical protein [Saccharopolyspora hordei]|uniref:Uncharacterized protein n=1 Tax=Saccharopolyspora hordei TaxID=1838 RepID=A0A853APW6_9PSEU|nr:hypothetical protein [Saccharopolyspora hordei]